MKNGCGKCEEIERKDRVMMNLFCARRSSDVLGEKVVSIGWLIWHVDGKGRRAGMGA